MMYSFNSYIFVQKKIKLTIITYYMLIKICPYKGLYTNIPHCFIFNNQNNPKCTLAAEWRSKLWHTHAIEHRSLISCEVLMYTTWMNFKAMLNENRLKEYIYVKC